MLVLALDTTTKTGGMALLEGESLIESVTGDPSQPHAARLPADLLRLLARHGRDLSEVEVFAVAAGPGSFTGLRIGIATMQGLAFASGRPLVGVSALEALALSAAESFCEGPRAIAAWMDGQRGEVFSAVYAVSVGARGAEPAAVLDDPVAAPPGDIVARWRAEGRLSALVAAGDGAIRYRDVLAACPAALVAGMVDATPALAPSVARLAWRRHASGGASPPHAIRPIYVRRPDAELARERRRGPV